MVQSSRSIRNLVTSNAIYIFIKNRFVAEGACEAQPYDKLQRNIRIEGETMRKDHVGRITPRLNKFPYRYGRDVNSRET